ncbi:hypothetical protein SOCE26_095470 [Sorangium cellulosum]|uniref:Uncharacterized protein n=1 Tax=Sorangium cellulosum TaxID=56 RepID=A0A2L0F929_SORCE|nr:hypothetical protein [Sorangium cellulosum]AUX48021.1 hypothetical protein SOCE26_095470 [Sorangium cellulosum]
MNQEKRVFPICGMALSSFLAAGCILDVTDHHPRPAPAPVGSLTVDWTVARRSDVRACAREGARDTEVEIIVYRGDREVAREFAHCEDFSLTVDLPPDEYKVYVTLVERGSDRPVTTTLPLEEIDIVKGADLNVDVDFPATSFLRR